MFQNLNQDEPIFPIRAAAQLLKISVHTLRMYEREGLIIPFKKESSHRLYSQTDLKRIECIRRAINEMKISINGIKTMYSLIPCWEIMGCSEENRKNCKSYNEHSKPCWGYAHENNVCEEKKCRDCEVYKKHSQCGEIKELIKSISR
ncbi:MAG: MerR family transcriptional regulator [Ignavibacteriales bacterium]|nr:MerR family transcriptional regulator [Ignavibacteriales bacterium]